MPRTYLFYDTETTGLNVAFDQVVRFAAIRTDEELREIERYALSVRLRPDVIPSPEALLTTGLTISDLLDGECEYEAIARIHALFNTPGTVTVGYNNLGYDDDLLRFSFYRNLLPPYSHQRAGRMDLLPMTVMVRLFRRHWLIWPEVDGKTSLKLEHLNRENDLSAGRAHDAMVDVEATLNLARRYHREPKEWKWLTGLFDKDEDRKRQATFPELCAGAEGENRLGLIAYSRIGAEEGYIAPVLSLGSSIPYKNQTLWLRLDKTDLSQITPENVAETTWAYRKKVGDNQLLLNLRPKYVEMLRGDRLARMNDNRRLLEARPDLLALIGDYHRNFRYPDVPDIDVDASLYADFLSPQEEMACWRFRAAARDALPVLVAEMPTHRLSALALRALGRNYPEILSGSAGAEFEAFMRCVNPAESGAALVDYKGGTRYTPSAAMARIVEIVAEPRTAEELVILAGLQGYLKQKFKTGLVT